ncbi:MAG: hypothetical protein PWR17_825 [Candidatus Methanomethylophilaceae archaeon]|nr:hypothetical protein [Candidatus Methanomethylophilaceae archaeon]
MPVKRIYLLGDPPVATMGAFQLLAYAELQAHLQSVKPDNPATLAVDVHHAVDAYPVQRFIQQTVDATLC